MFEIGVITVFTTQKDNIYPNIYRKCPTFATENKYKQQKTKIMRRSNSISNEAKSYTDNVKVALQNGCQWIQLSMGNSTDEEFVELASSIKNLCDEYHAYLIIEDHVRLAKQVKANGVHLNHKSCVAAARKELGARYLICVDAADHDEERRLQAQGADCTNEHKLGYKMFEMAVNCHNQIAYA